MLWHGRSSRFWNLLIPWYNGWSVRQLSSQIHDRDGPKEVKARHLVHNIANIQTREDSVHKTENVSRNHCLDITEIEWTPWGDTATRYTNILEQLILPILHHHFKKSFLIWPSQTLQVHRHKSSSFYFIFIIHLMVVAQNSLWRVSAPTKLQSF
jgi:hypothetical protein